MEAYRLSYQENLKKRDYSALDFLNQLGSQRFKKDFLLESSNENQMNAIVQHIIEYKIENRQLVYPEKGLFLIVENEKYVIPIFHMIIQHINNLYEEDKKLNSDESCNSENPKRKFISTQKIAIQLISGKPHEILDPLVKENDILFLSSFGNEEEVKVAYYNKIDFMPYIFSERHYQSKIFGSTITYTSCVKPEFTRRELAAEKESVLVLKWLVNRYGKQSVNLFMDLCNFVFLDRTFKVNY